MDLFNGTMLKIDKMTVGGRNLIQLEVEQQGALSSS